MRNRRRLDLSRLRRACRKLIGVGPRGWWLLLEAQWSILVAALTVSRKPRGELVGEVASSAARAEVARPEDEDRVDAAALAIDRMARFGAGQPLCLVRAIALQRLLQRRDIPGSRIRVGVRMKGQAFEAHAWVEWNGGVVGEDPEYVREFRPFSEISPRRERLTWFSARPQS